MQNRYRDKQLIVRVTEKEKQFIQKKMKVFGTENFNAYARKILIDGYIIHVDMTEFQKLSAEVNKIGVNINQIAKIANATDNICEKDIEKIKEMVEEIWQLLKSSLSEILSKTQ